MKILLKAAVLIMVAAMIFAVPVAMSQRSQLSPFSEIYSGDPADYAHYQMKFTYMGSQRRIIPSLGCVGPDREFDSTAFKPFERDLYYGNDEFTGDTLVLTLAEFKGFLDSIAAYSELQDTNMVENPNASIMILRDYDPDTKCWEHLADRDETRLLFELLYANLPDTADQTVVERYRRMMSGVRR